MPTVRKFPMRFRVRHNGGHKPSSEPAPSAQVEAPVANGTPPASDVALLERRLAGGHAPMKSQATGGDARAERLVRQVQNEVAELREALGTMRPPPTDLTVLDLDAVAKDPEAAAKLPSQLLVRALVDQHERNATLKRQLEERRKRIDELENRVRELEQECAWSRGRLQTLDDVIAALHANLQDLRLHRDSHQLEAPRPPVVERPDALAEPGGPARLP